MIRRTLILGAAALLAAGAAQAAVTVVGLSVTDAWSRPAAEGGNGAGFVTIANTGKAADRLVSASSPIAARVEIHESMVMNGRAMMHPRSGGVALPPGGKVEFKPGGLHLMLIGLKKPLKAGETFPVVLAFEKGGKVSVDFTVRATAPAAAPMPEHKH